MVDEKGALLSLDVKTDPLPFAALLGGKSDLTAELEQLPIGVRIDFPQRELSQLPLIVRPSGVRGAASVTLTMSGSARKPEIDLAVRTKGLTIAAAPTTPMDAAVSAKYDGSVAMVSAKVLSKTDSLLDASAELHADAEEALAMGAAVKWTGSAKAALARFPLAALSLHGHAPIKGFVSGDVAVSGLHEHAAAQANLAFDALQLGKAKFRKGDVHATVGDEGLDVATAQFHIAGLTFGALDLIILAVSLALMILLSAIMRSSPLGRNIRAVAEDRIAAALLGIDLERTIALTFFIASALGGAAGILTGLQYNSVSIDMGSRIELKGLAIIILGGMGSITGAVTGAFILGLVEALSVAYLSSSYRDAIAFLVMFLILIFRPTGLFGKRSLRSA